MERAGAEDIGADAERKGLGTPATRADIIEKLVKDGFVKREKKQIIPTEDGLKLITVLPDVVKSPKLTADWENALTLVAKGELPMEDFMADIENMVSELIHTYHEVSDEQKKMFAQEQEALGVCPNCGGQVVKGKFGAYCVKKCGMNVSRVMGAALSDAQVKDMLAGKKILLKGLKSKAGKPYDASSSARSSWTQIPSPSAILHTTPSSGSLMPASISIIVLSGTPDILESSTMLISSSFIIFNNLSPVVNISFSSLLFNCFFCCRYPGQNNILYI